MISSYYPCAYSGDHGNIVFLLSAKCGSICSCTFYNIFRSLQMVLSYRHDITYFCIWYNFSKPQIARVFCLNSLFSFLLLGSIYCAIPSKCYEIDQMPPWVSEAPYISDQSVSEMASMKSFLFLLLQSLLTKYSSALSVINSWFIWKTG